MTSTPLLPGRQLGLTSDENPTDEISRFWLWAAIILFSTCYYALGNEWETPLKGIEGFHSEAVDVEIVADQGKALWRLAFLGIGFTGLLLLIVPSPRRFAIYGMLGTVIVATYAYCWSSLLWSEFPSVTMRRLVVLSLTCLGAFGLSKHFTMRHIALLAMFHCLMVLAASVATELVHGTLVPWDPTFRFAGTLHPNQQAIKMAILCLASLSLIRCYPRWRTMLVAVACGALGVLLLTKSRSSLAALMIALAGVWVLGTTFQTKLITAILGFGFGGVVVAAGLSAGIDDTQSLAQAMSLGRDDDDPSSLTGRLEIWEYVMEDISERVWFGHGFNTYWNEERLTEAHRVLEWALPDAHNAYIDTIASIGLVGLGAVLVVVVLGAVQVGEQHMRQVDMGSTFILGLCLFGFLNGGFESHMLQPFNFTPFLVAAAFFRLAFFEPNDWPHEPVST